MFGQLGAVVWLGLSTIWARRGAALVVVVGMACAVGALISILSLSAGFDKTIKSTGRDDRVIVLSKNSIYEFASAIPHSYPAIIADAPGVKHDSDGSAILSAEGAAFAVVPKKSDGLNAFVDVRGIGPKGLALRPEVKLISGRMFQPGKHELIVGKLAVAQFQGLAEGSHVALPDGDWTVTGVFEAGGSAAESAMVADAATLLSTMRADTYKSVTVMLTAPSAYGPFRSALLANPALAVDVSRETDYLARDAQGLNTLLTTIAGLVGGIMGLGAMLGAINTMYNAVSVRTVEIATLRAIGFGGVAVMISVMAEALLLSAGGALLGAGLAWLAFNGNSHVMGDVVIALTVTPHLVLLGFLFACVLGLIGGFFPAIRAVRLPIVDALRAT